METQNQNLHRLQTNVAGDKACPEAEELVGWSLLPLEAEEETSGPRG